MSSSGDESPIRGSKKIGRAQASDASDAGDLDRASLASGDRDLVEDNDADLFGDGSEDGDRHNERRLDDEELDSGDDEGRFDRRGSPMEEDNMMDYGETLNVMDLNLARAPVPESTDGEFYTLTMPNFLNIESEDFNPETYVAPPFNTASTSLCWRYDPETGKNLQSNARIIRWSDGSLTLQLASNPQEQYRIASKRLAQPKNAQKAGGPQVDAHVYLGAPAEAASAIRLTSHLTAGLTVLPTTMETDDAVQRLRESLAAASRGSKKNVDGSVAMFDVKEDPELAKKQAELAEREKLREARKRQLAAERDLDRGRRVGIPRTGGSGLTVAGLEGEDEMGATRPRAKKPRRRPNRRGEIYSDDEDEFERRGHTREDEYDEDDGFLVGSDEEPEMVEEEEEEEDFDEDADAEGEIDEEIPPAKESVQERSPSPKRSAEEEEPTSKSPETGGGDAGSPPTRKKHRYVVDDDEDE